MARLALPLTISDSGRLVTIEQDSAEDIAQCVALILDTRPGERAAFPEFGLPDPLFADLDIDEIAETVQRWEERADQLTIEQIAAGMFPELEVHASHTPAGTDEADDIDSDEEV